MSQMPPPIPPQHPNPYAGNPSTMQGQYMQPHRATMVFVLGLLGLLICFICGIVAWVMGSKDLKEIDAGRMDPSGRGLTQAGWILGIIGTVLGGLAFCVVAGYFVLVMSVLGAAAAGGAGASGGGTTP
ncbi:MAG: DUF4190 domain-containing protein [Phycisphaerales bacterium]|nr:DUF4190 domain-containing protein [Phycisphaerales bacterium]